MAEEAEEAAAAAAGAADVELAVALLLGGAVSDTVSGTAGGISQQVEPLKLPNSDDARPAEERAEATEARVLDPTGAAE